MPAPAELVNLPHAVAEMIGRSRADHERALRAVRWGQLPLWAVGAPPALPAAEALGAAFEDLLRWPVIVREAGAFLDGALGMLHPGSVVLAFAGEGGAGQQVAAAARKRGAQALVIAGAAPTGEPLPDAILVPSSGAASAGSLGAACLEHAVAAQLALICARQLTRPQPRLERSERGWREVPAHLERIVGQMGDGVDAAVRELESSHHILVLGGGFTRPVAQRAAMMMRQRGARTAVGLAFDDLAGGWLQVSGRESAALLVSVGGARDARAATEWAARLKERSCPVVTITSGSQFELSHQARFGLLLPELSDLAGSFLALTVTAWIADRLAAASRPGVPRAVVP